jgi:nucleotide-binding universal stress UspA family protein
MAERKTSIQRILVALDASPASVSALQTAVELAARLEARLVGLFVEDINLLRVAQLPFAREVSLFSPRFRRLESRELERQLRVQAERMRQAMAQLAADSNIDWDFRVTRGSVPGEVMTAGAEADLVILGKVGRSLSAARRMGSTVRMLVMQRSGLTLILQPGGRLTVPVVALYDGSESGESALEAAGQLVKAEDGKLTILILAESKEEARTLQMNTLKRLQQLGLGADFRLLIKPTTGGLLQLVQRETTGPVVIPCGLERLQGERLCALIDEVPNPVLLVR